LLAHTPRDQSSSRPHTTPLPLPTRRSSDLMTVSEEILTDTWQQVGDQTRYPMITYGNGYYFDDQGNPSDTQVQYGSENKTPSTLYLEKGDYLRLKSLQIGCTLKNYYLYLSGNNLLTF